MTMLMMVLEMTDAMPFASMLEYAVGVSSASGIPMITSWDTAASHDAKRSAVEALIAKQCETSRIKVLKTVGIRIRVFNTTGHASMHDLPERSVVADITDATSDDMVDWFDNSTSTARRFFGGAAQARRWVALDRIACRIDDAVRRNEGMAPQSSCA